MISTSAPEVAPRPLRTRRLGAVVAVGAAIAFVALILVRHTGSGSTSRPSAPVTADKAIVSAEQLAATAGSLGHPIYWAGPIAETSYELAQMTGGSTFVRYLPNGVALGDPAPQLTVATYPVANAYGATATAAKRPGAVKLTVGPNTVAFYDSSRPTNVYEAFKGSAYQIEVFAPSAQQAQEIVSGGQVIPAGGPAPPSQGPLAATPEDLAAASKTLERPIYWMGSRPDVKYELTAMPNGRVYVRYLPVTAKVGTSVGYLTIGTYPLKNAYAATASAASRPGAVRLTFEHGVAFYSKSRPQSIYVAFPGVDEQIEVWDPAPTNIYALVAAGKIVPVP